MSPVSRVVVLDDDSYFSIEYKNEEAYREVLDQPPNPYVRERLVNCRQQRYLIHKINEKIRTFTAQRFQRLMGYAKTNVRMVTDGGHEALRDCKSRIAGTVEAA